MQAYGHISETCKMVDAGTVWVRSTSGRRSTTWQSSTSGKASRCALLRNIEPAMLAALLLHSSVSGLPVLNVRMWRPHADSLWVPCFGNAWSPCAFTDNLVASAEKAASQSTGRPQGASAVVPSAGFVAGFERRTAEASCGYLVWLVSPSAKATTLGFSPQAQDTHSCCQSWQARLSEMMVVIAKLIRLWPAPC